MQRELDLAFRALGFLEWARSLVACLPGYDAGVAEGSIREAMKLIEELLNLLEERHEKELRGEVA